MPQLSLDSQVAKDSRQVIDRVVDGEALLIHLSTGNYFSLNGIGTAIWESLDGTKTIRALAEDISAEYDVDPEQAQADALNLVGDLVKEGLAVVTQ
jgi:hypothetical protein